MQSCIRRRRGEATNTLTIMETADRPEDEMITQVTTSWRGEATNTPTIMETADRPEDEMITQVTTSWRGEATNTPTIMKTSDRPEDEMITQVTTSWRGEATNTPTIMKTSDRPEDEMITQVTTSWRGEATNTPTIMKTSDRPENEMITQVTTSWSGPPETQPSSTALSSTISSALSSTISSSELSSTMSSALSSTISSPELSSTKSSELSSTISSELSSTKSSELSSTISSSALSSTISSALPSFTMTPQMSSNPLSSSSSSSSSPSSLPVSSSLFSSTQSSSSSSSLSSSSSPSAPSSQILLALPPSPSTPPPPSSSPSPSSSSSLPRPRSTTKALTRKDTALPLRSHFRHLGRLSPSRNIWRFREWMWMFLCLLGCITSVAAASASSSTTDTNFPSFPSETERPAFQKTVVSSSPIPTVGNTTQSNSNPTSSITRLSTQGHNVQLPLFSTSPLSVHHNSDLSSTSIDSANIQPVRNSLSTISESNSIVVQSSMQTNQNQIESTLTTSNSVVSNSNSVTPSLSEAGVLVDSGEILFRSLSSMSNTLHIESSSVLQTDTHQDRAKTISVKDSVVLQSNSLQEEVENSRSVITQTSSVKRLADTVSESTFHTDGSGSSSVSATPSQQTQTSIPSSSYQPLQPSPVEPQSGLHSTKSVTSLEDSKQPTGKQVQNSITSVPVLPSFSRSESESNSIFSNSPLLSQYVSTSLDESHTSIINTAVMSDSVALFISSRSDHDLVLNTHSLSLDVSDSQSRRLSQPSNSEIGMTNFGSSTGSANPPFSSSLVREVDTSISPQTNSVSDVAPSETESLFSLSRDRHSETKSSRNSMSLGSSENKDSSATTEPESYSKTELLSISPSKESFGSGLQTSSLTRHNNSEVSLSPTAHFESKMTSQSISQSNEPLNDASSPAPINSMNGTPSMPITVSAQSLRPSASEENVNKGTDETESNSKKQNIETTSDIASSMSGYLTTSQHIGVLSLTDISHGSIDTTPIGDEFTLSSKSEISVSLTTALRPSSSHSASSAESDNIMTSRFSEAASGDSTAMRSRADIESSTNDITSISDRSRVTDDSELFSPTDSLSPMESSLSAKIESPHLNSLSASFVSSDTTLKSQDQTSPLESVGNASTSEDEGRMSMNMFVSSTSPFQDIDISSEVNSQTSFVSEAGLNPTFSLKTTQGTSSFSADTTSSQMSASSLQTEIATENTTGDSGIPETIQTPGGIPSTSSHVLHSASTGSYSSMVEERTFTEFQSDSAGTVLVTPTTPSQRESNSEAKGNQATQLSDSFSSKSTEHFSTDSQEFADNNTAIDIQSVSVDTPLETIKTKTIHAIAPSSPNVESKMMSQSFGQSNEPLNDVSSPISINSSYETSSMSYATDITETLRTTHHVSMATPTVVFSSFSTDNDVTAGMSPTPSNPNLVSNSTPILLSDTVMTSLTISASNESNSGLESSSNDMTSSQVGNRKESVSDFLDPSGAQNTQSIASSESSYGSLNDNIMSSGVRPLSGISDTATSSTFQNSIIEGTVLSQRMSASTDHAFTNDTVDFTKSLDMSEIIQSDIDSTDSQPISDVSSSETAHESDGFTSDVRPTSPLASSQSSNVRENGTFSSSFHAGLQSTTSIERDRTSSNDDTTRSTDVQDTFLPAATITLITLNDLSNATVKPSDLEISSFKENPNFSLESLEASSLSLNITSTLISMETVTRKENTSSILDALESMSGTRSLNLTTVDVQTQMASHTETVSSMLLDLSPTSMQSDFGSNSVNLSPSGISESVSMSTIFGTPSSTIVGFESSSLIEQNSTSLTPHIIQPTSVQIGSKSNEVLETDDGRGNFTSTSILEEVSSLHNNISSSLDLLSSTIVNQINTSSGMFISDTLQTSLEDTSFSNHTAAITPLSSVSQVVNFTNSLEVSPGVSVSTFDFISTPRFDLSQTITSGLEESSVRLTTTFVDNNASLATRLESSTMGTVVSSTQIMTTAGVQSQSTLSDWPLTMTATVGENTASNATQIFSGDYISSVETSDAIDKVSSMGIDTTAVFDESSVIMVMTSTGHYNTTYTESQDNYASIQSSVSDRTDSNPPPTPTTTPFVESSTTAAANATKVSTASSIEIIHESATFTSIPASNASLDLLESTMLFSTTTIIQTSDNSTLETFSTELTSTLGANTTASQSVLLSIVDATETSITPFKANSTIFEELSFSTSEISVSESLSTVYNNSTVIFSSIDVSKIDPTAIAYNDTTVDVSEVTSTAIMSNTTTNDVSTSYSSIMYSSSSSTPDVSEIYPTPMISNSSTIEVSEIYPTPLVSKSSTVDVSEIYPTSMISNSSTADQSEIYPTPLVSNSSTVDVSEIYPTPMISNSSTVDVSEIYPTPLVSNSSTVDVSEIYPTPTTSNSSTVDVSEIYPTPFLSNSPTDEVSEIYPTPMISNSSTVDVSEIYPTSMISNSSTADISEIYPTPLVSNSSTADVSEVYPTPLVSNSSTADVSEIYPTPMVSNSPTPDLSELSATPIFSNSTMSDEASASSQSSDIEPISPSATNSTQFQSDSAINETSPTQTLLITPTLIETSLSPSSQPTNSSYSVDLETSSYFFTNSTMLATPEVTPTSTKTQLLSSSIIPESSLEPNKSSERPTSSETSLSTLYLDRNSSLLSDDSIIATSSHTLSSSMSVTETPLSSLNTTQSLSPSFESSTPNSLQTSSKITHNASTTIQESPTINTTMISESTILSSSAETSQNATSSTVSLIISTVSDTTLQISTTSVNMSTPNLQTNYTTLVYYTSPGDTIYLTPSSTMVIITDSTQNYTTETHSTSLTETTISDNTITSTLVPSTPISFSDTSPSSLQKSSDVITNSILTILDNTTSSNPVLATTDMSLSSISFSPPATPSIFHSQTDTVSLSLSVSATHLSPTPISSSSYPDQSSSSPTITMETNKSTSFISNILNSDSTATYSYIDTTQTTITLDSITSIQVSDTSVSSYVTSESTPSHSQIPSSSIFTTILSSSEPISEASSSEMASPSFTLSFSSTTSTLTSSSMSDVKSTLSSSLLSSPSSLSISISSSTSSSSSSSAPASSSSLSSLSLSSSLPSSSLSSLPPSSPPPTGSTLPTIDNSGHLTSYWVSVGLLVRTSVDVTTPQFKSKMELGLANAYALSRERQEEIANGTFEPLGKKRRRRRKRAASATNDPNVEVEVTSIQRDGSTTAVAVNHVIQQDGVLVPAGDAAKQMALLNDMELAIQLKEMVSEGPQPYISPSTTSDNDDDNTAIIAGAVSGAVAAIIVIVVIIICCCCGGNRCCVRKSSGEFRITDLTEKRQVVPSMASENPSYYVDDESQGNVTMSITSKKGKYTLPDVGNETDDTEKTNGQRPMPVRRPPHGKKTTVERYHDAPSAENENDERKASPKKKKGKKKKEMDTDEAMEMRSVYESQIASLPDSPSHTEMSPAVTNVDLVITGPPTVEMEEDLLENAEEERRKNKQRLREKRRQEKQSQSPIKKSEDTIDVVYESAQKEIDKVLGPRKDALKAEGTKKKSKDKKKKKEKSDDSDDTSQQEEAPPVESLEEARVKIHRLLDDAFSLISQSRSSMGSTSSLRVLKRNKVHPTSQQSSVDKGSPRSQQSHRSHSSIEPADQDIENPAVEEKKHTPLYVERSHGAYDRSGLISWSPYRASDDTALISLPNTQTNLNAVAPQRDPIKGTTVFSESLPSSLQPSYYTTLPGEPIVLNTKTLDSNHKPPHHNNHDHHHHQNEHPNHHSQHNQHRPSGLGDTINIKSNDTPSTASDFDPRVKGHKGYVSVNGDEFYTPYYGMSSYQELPPSSVVPNSPRGDNGYSQNANRDYYSSSEGDHDYHGNHTNSVNNESNFNDGLKTAHNAPSKGGENRGKDFVDVIKDSVQPGASPQPLIHSLREELMNLSRKKGISSTEHHITPGGTRENGQGRPSTMSKTDGKPPLSGTTSLGQDVYHRNNRNRHMKTDL